MICLHMVEKYMARYAPMLSNCDKVYHNSASTWLLYFPQVTVLSGKCEKNNHWKKGGREE